MTLQANKLAIAFAWTILAAGAFHLSYLGPGAAFLVVVYLFSLLQLARARTSRGAFYSGLAVGLLIGLGRLDFLWRIFSAGAIALWLVYAFWIGLFVALARLCLQATPRSRVQSLGWWCCLPLLWCGIEYFRSELYYLRFAWLTPGFAFGLAPNYVPLAALGVYGMGFLLLAMASFGAFVWQKSPAGSLLVLAVGVLGLYLGGAIARAPASESGAASLKVAGAQMEFPTETDALVRLDALVRNYPDAQLLVLSEYTFLGKIPQKIQDWCREHQRYLLLGAEEPASGGNFYNTAFVISPAGDIVFRQAKRVPIQFFKDGLPAPAQKVWESPWGKIGICICYDLSYRRVTDRLVALGAEVLIVPTMDVADWGPRQHRLHARVAPVRAAEYGLPIFRLASSGVSQLVDRCGRVVVSAPFGGDGELLSGTLLLAARGHLPLDHWLAPAATLFTALLMFFLLVRHLRNRRGARAFSAAGPESAPAPVVVNGSANSGCPLP